MRVTDAAVAEAMEYPGFIDLLRDHVPPENCLAVLSALSCDRPGKREVRIVRDLINGLDEIHWSKLMEFVDFYGCSYIHELSGHRSPTELVIFLNAVSNAERVENAQRALRAIAAAWANDQRLAKTDLQSAVPGGDYIIMFKEYVPRGRSFGSWAYEIAVGKPEPVKTRGRKKFEVKGEYSRYSYFRIDKILWAYRIVTDPAECASIPAPELGVRARKILAKYAPSAAASV